MFFFTIACHHANSGSADNYDKHYFLFQLSSLLDCLDLVVLHFLIYSPLCLCSASLQHILEVPDGVHLAVPFVCDLVINCYRKSKRLPIQRPLCGRVFEGPILFAANVQPPDCRVRPELFGIWVGLEN